MRIKKTVSILLCASLVLISSGCSGSDNPLQVMNSDGGLLAKIGSDSDIEKNKQHFYLEIVVDEAAEIISKKEDCSNETAREKLFEDGYKIKTAFDRAVSDSLNNACKEFEGMDMGSAVTDLKGNLIAVYSSEGETNFATEPNAPCSAFKPLSVYAPAIDKGIINWSSRYEDSPYKQVKNSDGTMRDWPRNANGIYTERYAYIFQAVKESLNTVAVKCLADLGVENSIDFLKKELGMSLSDELYTSTIYGEEEIIGNIAMGYLEKGAGAIDMAGYYQMFANGGYYEAPKTILSITDSSGKEIYKREYTEKQVIKETTSEIMNYLLREVVTPDGTGKDAACERVQVAGKTGTDETGGNNWFVGVTPEYSLAFWHSHSTDNISPEIFAKSVDKIYASKPEAKTEFTYKANISSIAYCTETGQMAGPGCALIRLGYYTHDNLPSLCDRH